MPEEAPSDAEHVPNRAGEQPVVEVERDQLGAASQSLRVQIRESVVRHGQRVGAGETCRGNLIKLSIIQASSH